MDILYIVQRHKIKLFKYTGFVASSYQKVLHPIKLVQVYQSFYAKQNVLIRYAEAQH